MKILIETNKAVIGNAEKKAEQLQVLSNVMNDQVLQLFSSIASKAKTPAQIAEFNKKVTDNEAIISGMFDPEKGFFGNVKNVVKGLM